MISPMQERICLDDLLAEVPPGNHRAGQNADRQSTNNIGDVPGGRKPETPETDKIVNSSSRRSMKNTITGKNQPAFRVGRQVVQLLFQFRTIVPVIVPFAESQIGAPAGLHRAVAVLSCPDVFVRRDYTDQVRVLFLKSEYDLPSAVGRAILADNELDRKIDLLIKNALNRLADRCSMIVRYHVDAYDRTRIRLSYLAPVFDILDFRAGGNYGGKLQSLGTLFKISAPARKINEPIRFLGFLLVQVSRTTRNRLMGGTSPISGGLGFCVQVSIGRIMKVLLAMPIREGGNLQITPDLGVLCLGTALKAHGHQVTLLDCANEGMTFSAYRKYLESHSFDVVGFRCFSRDHNYVRHHLKILRQVDPNALTLVGGPHPSALPEFVFKTMHPDLDFAWRSEAEEGLPALLTLVEKHGRQIPEDLLTGISGLVWRSPRDGKINMNPAVFSNDLDRYGIPAWEMIRPDTYPGFIYDEFYPVLTTRGCPYPCTYCNTPTLSGKKLRHRGAAQVIEELAFLKGKYKIKRFSIVDDEFTLDADYALGFCRQLLKADLGLRWDCPSGVRLDSLFPELVRAMEKSGCESMAVGIESGNPRVLGLIQKKVTVEKIREKAEMVARNCGIKLIGYFIIGFPDETEDEILETIKLAKSLPLVRANFNILIPIPGTAIFADAIRSGKLNLEHINWDTFTSDQVTLNCGRVSGERLIQLRRKAYFAFYGRPRMIRQLLQDSLANRRVLPAIAKNVKKLLRRSTTESHIPLYKVNT